MPHTEHHPQMHQHQLSEYPIRYQFGRGQQPLHLTYRPDAPTHQHHHLPSQLSLPYPVTQAGQFGSFLPPRSQSPRTVLDHQQPPSSMSLYQLQARGFHYAKTKNITPKFKRGIKQTPHKRGKTLAKSTLSSKKGIMKNRTADIGPSKAKKTVHFAPNATVAYRPAMSKEEIDQSWYRPIDYTKFQDSRRQSIQAITEYLIQSQQQQQNENENSWNRCFDDARDDEHGYNTIDPLEHTMTGLEEQLTRKQILARRLKTLHHKKLVLQLYKSNQLSNQNDEKKAITEYTQDTSECEKKSLRAMSEMFARQSMKRAHLRAVMGSAV